MATAITVWKFMFRRHLLRAHSLSDSGIRNCKAGLMIASLVFCAASATAANAMDRGQFANVPVEVRKRLVASSHALLAESKRLLATVGYHAARSAWHCQQVSQLSPRWPRSHAEWAQFERLTTRDLPALPYPLQSPSSSPLLRSHSGCRSFRSRPR